MAWKLHDFKKNALNKMDEAAFKNDPHNRPNYNQNSSNNKKK